jgi:hypothetical protein
MQNYGNRGVNNSAIWFTTICVFVLNRNRLFLFEKKNTLQNKYTKANVLNKGRTYRRIKRRNGGGGGGGVMGYIKFNIGKKQKKIYS